ncbi:hypothetical protein IV102_37140, partial [bacterium]|nr:hypothetical protein [bacterium]
MIVKAGGLGPDLRCRVHTVGRPVHDDDVFLDLNAAMAKVGHPATFQDAAVLAEEKGALPSIPGLDVNDVGQFSGFDFGSSTTSALAS